MKKSQNLCNVYQGNLKVKQDFLIGRLSKEELHIFQNIDLTYIKGVLIDIDNTLYAYEPAHKKSLRNMSSVFL